MSPSVLFFGKHLNGVPVLDDYIILCAFDSCGLIITEAGKRMISAVIK